MFKNLSLVVAFCFIAFTFGCNNATVPKQADPTIVSEAETARLKEIQAKVASGEMTEAQGEVQEALPAGNKGGPKKPNPGAPPN